LRPNLSAVPAGRAALAAGALGFAAGIGLLGSTLAVLGVGPLLVAPKSERGPAPWSTAAEETRALKQSIARLESQVTKLKASIDASGRQASTQRNQIAERHQRNTQTQVDMQARLVKIDDAIERLEKRVTAAVTADITGSVAPKYAAAAAAISPQPAAAEAKEPPEPPVVSGWVIRDVFRGRALVAGRRGVFEAAPGVHLPELGRVEAVTRRDGRWVVITEKGIITAFRRPGSAYRMN
jgi:hypothetical protein